jgi:hypothetical protein
MSNKQKALAAIILGALLIGSIYAGTTLYLAPLFAFLAAYITWRRFDRWVTYWWYSCYDRGVINRVI